MTEAELLLKYKRLKQFIKNNLNKEDHKQKFNDLVSIEEKSSEKMIVRKKCFQRINLQLQVELIIQSFTIKEFTDEIKALKKIKRLLEKKGFDLEMTKHQIWRFRHAYEFKESVYHYHKRILLDETLNSIGIKLKRGGDKLAKEIIEKSSLWVIPETNYFNSNKRIQRFISQDAYNKINQYRKTSGGEPITKVSIPWYCPTKKCGIEMDHMLSKFLLLKYIESIAVDLKNKTAKERKKIINEKINSILPYMIGVLVTRQENDNLANKEKQITEKNNPTDIFLKIKDHLKKLYDEISILDADKNYKIFNWETDTLKVDYNISSINLERTKS